jgi:hypothetical protein
MLAGKISESLEELRNPSFPDDGADRTTHIFIDGFFAGYPKRSKIEFYNLRGRPVPEIKTVDLFPGKLQAYGSRKVYGMLFGKASTGLLQQYRERCKIDVRTLPQAVDVVLSFIQAHCDQEALGIDPDMCSAVGGRIRIATVTLEAGFQWAPGFGA